MFAVPGKRQLCPASFKSEVKWDQRRWLTSSSQNGVRHGTSVLLQRRPYKSVLSGCIIIFMASRHQAYRNHRLSFNHTRIFVWSLEAPGHCTAA